MIKKLITGINYFEIYRFKLLNSKFIFFIVYILLNNLFFSISFQCALLKNIINHYTFI